MKTIKMTVATVAAAFLASCATLPPDAGLDGVRAAAGTRLKGELHYASDEAGRDRVAAFVRERLAGEIDAESAVAIALMSNPGLQVAYSELGVAQADLVQAGRLRNPGFSIARLKRGDEREIERTFTIDVIGLLAIPWRIEAERAMYTATQGRTAIEVVRVADQARRAWVEAVAAAERERYAGQVTEATAAGAELARQMGRAGNWSALSQSREQLFHAQAVAQLARSRHQAVAAREALVRVLGLSGADVDALKLPARLPDPPAAPREWRDAEATAIAQRLDVAAAKAELAALQHSLGLFRATRFINVLHLGYQNNSSNEAPRQTGYELELEIPIFDWGDAKLARAEARYMGSAHRLAQTAVRARSEVRETWSAYTTAWELARQYREEIVPLRKRISDENLLRYNGMLIGVFELLADSRDQIGAVQGALDALRDFWIAQANLETALMTGSPGAAPSLSTVAAPASAGH